MNFSVDFKGQLCTIRAILDTQSPPSSPDFNMMRQFFVQHDYSIYESSANHISILKALFMPENWTETEKNFIQAVINKCSPPVQPVFTSVSPMMPLPKPFPKTAVVRVISPSSAPPVTLQKILFKPISTPPKASSLKRRKETTNESSSPEIKKVKHLIVERNRRLKIANELTRLKKILSLKVPNYRLPNEVYDFLSNLMKQLDITTSADLLDKIKTIISISSAIGFFPPVIQHTHAAAAHKTALPSPMVGEESKQKDTIARITSATGVDNLRELFNLPNLNIAETLSHAFTLIEQSFDALGVTTPTEALNKVSGLMENAKRKSELSKLLPPEEELDFKPPASCF